MPRTLGRNHNVGWNRSQVMLVNAPGRRAQDFFECLLLSDGAVPVKAAAFKEAVPHHALPKEEKDDGQDDYKQELSNPERGWVSSCGRSVVHGLLSQKAPRCNLWSRLVKQQGQKADHRLARFVFRSSLCGRLCRFHRSTYPPATSLACRRLNSGFLAASFPL